VGDTISCGASNREIHVRKRVYFASLSIHLEMSLFITVGSTYFDQLIQETASSAFLNSLASLGIKKVVFQYGASEHIFNENIQAYNKGPVMDIEGYKYKSSIQKDIEQADIIISHAGS
jgi:beta-1,4-N-acetylglucosaminyltransferase